MSHQERNANNRQRLEAEIARIETLLDKKGEIGTATLQELVHSIQVYQEVLSLQNLELAERNNENAILREHYYSLFSLLPIPVLILDEYLVAYDTNQAAKKLFSSQHYPFTQAKSVMTLFDQANISKLFSAIYQNKTEKIPQLLELTYLQAEREFIFSVLLDQIKIEGESKRYLLVFRDITAEKAYSQQSALFMSMMDSANASLIALDLEGKVSQFSSNVTQFLPHDSKVNKTNLLHLLPGNISTLITEYVAVLALTAEKVDKNVEVTDRFSLGSNWLRIQLFPIQAKQQLLGVGCILSDNTQYVKQDAELSLAVRIFNEGQQALMVTDSEQRIVQVNVAFENITGYSLEDVLGETPKILRSGQHDPAFYQQMWQTIRAKGAWEGEVWNKRKDGEVYAQWLSITAHPKYATKPTNYIALFRDISQQKWQEQQISQLAFYDPLTGCGNRRLLESHVNQLVKADPSDSFVMLFIDLDHFKNVNDVHGHGYGDELLKAVIGRFKHTIRSSDHIYRVGGDEFVILLKMLSTSDVIDKADKLIEAASLPFFIKQIELHISASIGISRFPDDGTDFVLLLKHADTAMYEAKEQGRHCFRFFSESMMVQVLRKVRMDQLLRNALANKELSLAIMPQINCKTLKCERAEGLLRWYNSELGSVGPLEFIAIAERSELIHDLTLFVVTEALRVIRAVNTLSNKPFKLSVNFSIKDLKNASSFANLLLLLHKNNDITHQLTVEVTESIFIDDYELIVMHLDKLKELNIAISIDDFGTGYSCLSYLQELPINELKIDKSFISQLSRDKNICLAIISLAKSLGYECVAEGVETVQQLCWLQDLHCDFSQGYLHAKPMPIAEFLDEYFLANS